MRKNLLVLIVLMSYPTFAQISSGTIIIFNFTKDELVVAADSRGISENTLRSYTPASEYLVNEFCPSSPTFLSALASPNNVRVGV
jgi:hypothetical protein